MLISDDSPSTEGPVAGSLGLTLEPPNDGPTFKFPNAWIPIAERPRKCLSHHKRHRQFVHGAPLSSTGRGGCPTPANC
jgi:hypothetical protein